MLKDLKIWSWDRATTGMRVIVARLDKFKSFNGTIVEVKKKDRCRMIDGKPVRSSKVVSVTVELDCGIEIEVIRGEKNPKYQIMLPPQ